MGNYRQFCCQIIFDTKHRQPTVDETNCRELYQNISGMIKRKSYNLYRINGMEDHIYIFSYLHHRPLSPIQPLWGCSAFRLLVTVSFTHGY